MAEAVKPAEEGYNFDELLAGHSVELSCAGAGHILQPGGFVLGWTVEKICLPFESRLAARVEGKSSLARLGVGVHVTAPTIHAGFGFKPQLSTAKPGGKKKKVVQGSPLQLEIWNIGPLRVQLKAGMRICQLIFEWVDATPEKAYAGQFVHQGPK